MQQHSRGSRTRSTLEIVPDIGANTGPTTLFPNQGSIAWMEEPFKEDLLKFAQLVTSNEDAILFLDPTTGNVHTLLDDDTNNFAVCSVRKISPAKGYTLDFMQPKKDDGPELHFSVVVRNGSFSIQTYGGSNSDKDISKNNAIGLMEKFMGPLKGTLDKQHRRVDSYDTLIDMYRLHAPRLAKFGSTILSKFYR